MKGRILFVLTTLIIIFCINKFYLQKDINKLIENTNTINVSGKQRMYSQKISKQALYYLDDIKNVATNKETLKATVKSFSTSHYRLKNNLDNINDEYLNDLFKESDPYFKSIIDNANSITSDNATRVEILKNVNTVISSANSFLPIMDAIVNQYETIGKERGEIVLRREFTFNIILVGLFVYSLIFIITPAIRTFNEKEQLTSF